VPPGSSEPGPFAGRFGGEVWLGGVAELDRGFFLDGGLGFGGGLELDGGAVRGTRRMRWVGVEPGSGGLDGSSNQPRGWPAGGE
jgi:hypothetical protein